MLLLRDQPDNKEEQRAAFKRFAAGLTPADHVLKVTPNGFIWDTVEIPIGREEVSALHDHFRAHGVGEIRIPVGLMTSTLLSLVRILAAPAGTYGSFDHLTARLDAAGCGVVPVLPPDGPAPVPVETPDPHAMTPGLTPHERPSDSAPAPAPREAERPPTAGTGPRPVLPKSDKPEEEGRLADLGPDAVSEAQVGMMHFVTMQTRALGHTDELVHSLAEAKSGEDVTERLNQLIVAGEAAAQKAEWKEVLTAAYGLVQLESKAGDHRGFIIALRRLLPRSVMERIAQLTSNTIHKTEAIAVLRRMGADGAEVLLHALVNAEDIGERRAYFNAMKEMTEGGELLIHMLSHDQWFVVRNVADLTAEMKLENAVPALAKQSSHSDERARRAVAGALAAIGGSGAVEPLRRLLRDPVAGRAVGGGEGARWAQEPRPRHEPRRRRRRRVQAGCPEGDVLRAGAHRLGRSHPGAPQGGRTRWQAVSSQADRGAACGGGRAARRWPVRCQCAQGTAARRRPGSA